MFDQHRCELFKTSEASFTAGNNRGASNFFDAWITISQVHPLCKEYLISLAALNREKKRHKDTGYWWIIHPFSKLRFLWETVMTIVYGMAFITIPLIISFIIFDYESVNYDYFNSFLYVFCWIDVVASYVTGYYDHHSDEFILEQSKIINRYLRTFFLIDIITSLPYDQLTSSWRHLSAEDDHSNMIELINLLPLFKLIRYATFKKYLKQILLYFHFEGAPSQLILTLTFYTYVIHWFTCFCNLTPLLIIYFQDENVEDTEETWLLTESGFGLIARYQRSLYIVLENLSGSGYGGIKPVSSAHLFVCTILMILGRLFECYIIIMLLQIVLDRNASESKYEETINQLSAYSSQKQLPSYMKRRLLVYYHYRFRNSYFREKKILSTLSEELRQEVVLHSCRRLVENVDIFQDLPRNVLIQIVSHLKPELYLAKDMIIKAGTQGDCMFFLASGTVVILTPTGREVCFLEDGAHFGEVALLVQDQRRVASVVAVEVCEVYRLDRREFRKCIAVHSDLFAKIERMATERMHRTLLIEEEYKRINMQSKTPFVSNPELSD